MGPRTVYPQRCVDKYGIARKKEQDFSQSPLRAPDKRELALEGEGVVIELEREEDPSDNTQQMHHGWCTHQKCERADCLEGELSKVVEELKARTNHILSMTQIRYTNGHMNRQSKARHTDIRTLSIW